MRHILMTLLMAAATLPVFGCATDLVGDPSALDKMEYPTGMAVHPNGRYAYVVGSNFDLDYRADDGGAVYVVDLENHAIMPGSKRMGSFGTNIVLSSDGRRGYTVTRDDDALVWFEISEDGSSISCPKEKASSKSLLKCREILEDDPTFIAMTRSYREKIEYDEAGTAHMTRTDFDLLMIPQLENGRMTMMTVRTNEKGRPVFSYKSAALMYGASEALWLNGERFAVTGRAAKNLLIVSPAISESGKVLGLYASQAVSVPSGYDMYQGRGMTADPAHQNMYMLNQYPRSLMKFDITGLGNDSGTTDRAAMTAMTLLHTDMTKIIWVGSIDNGMLYATSVIDNKIYIFNPKSLEIASSVSVGDGPYEMNLVGNSLYVLNFRGGDIWKYDVTDPLNPVLESKILSKDGVSE